MSFLMCPRHMCESGAVCCFYQNQSKKFQKIFVFLFDFSGKGNPLIIIPGTLLHYQSCIVPKYEKQSGSISRPRHPLLIFIDNLIIRLKISDQVYFARRPSGTFIRLWYEWRWYGALPPPHHGRPRQRFSAQDLHLNSQEGIRWGEANFPSERKTGEHCVRRKSPPCDDHRALR